MKNLNKYTLILGVIIVGFLFFLNPNIVFGQCVPVGGTGCVASSDCCSGNCFQGGDGPYYCCTPNTTCSCSEADKNGNGVVNILDMMQCTVNCISDCDCYPCVSCVQKWFGQICPLCKLDSQVCSGGSECCSGNCNGTCFTPPSCTVSWCQMPAGGGAPTATVASCGVSCESQGLQQIGSGHSFICPGGVGGPLCFCCAPLPQYLLQTSKTGTGYGAITSSPSGINCGADCSENYVANTTVNLTATPSHTYVFAGWSGACSGTGSCSVVMSQSRTVTAIFNMYPSIGYVKVKGPGTMGIIKLRLISVVNALLAKNGTVKVARFAGDIQTAADLVATSSPDASPVRIMTPMGIKAWRMQK